MHLIFGCGYLGERVARRWEAQGQAVAAVTRSAERVAAWEAAGRTAVLADVTQPNSLTALPPAEVVLWAVGLDRAGSDMHSVYVTGLANVLQALERHPPRRLIYVSSTSVHGAADGQRITEPSSCTPDRENGRVCLAAEQLLHRSSLAERCTILRLAGIYGPGRLPNLARLGAGEPIAAEPEHRLNLIHVEDAASAVLAAAQQTNTDQDDKAAGVQLFLVADVASPTRREFYTEAAQLWGTPPPEFQPAEGATGRRGSTSDKVIDSSKLRRDLLPQLQYPDYRAGLAAIRESE